MPPSRLDELTERARRTLARATHGAPARSAQRLAAAAPVAPVASVPTVDGMPPLPAVPALPAPPRAPAFRRDSSGGAAQIVLGIDPGSATTGYGIVAPAEGHPGEGGLHAFRALTYGVLTTERHEPTEQRLLSLYHQLRDLIGEYRPTHVAIEQLFFGRNVTTAVTVGQARGVLLLAIAEAGLSISEYKPAEIKFTVAGFGKADKVQMQRMVQLLLGLDAVPRPDDAADALAIALCHLRHAQTRAVGLR
jgi:crossover junction endodeoxyribonuclease RuvC